MKKRFSAVGEKHTLSYIQGLDIGASQVAPDSNDFHEFYYTIQTDTCFGWSEVAPSALTVRLPDQSDRFWPENMQKFWLEGYPQLNPSGQGVYTATFDATKQKQLETTLYVKAPWYI